MREQSDDEREKHAVCSFEVPSGDRRLFFYRGLGFLSARCVLIRVVVCLKRGGGVHSVSMVCI